MCSAFKEEEKSWTDFYIMSKDRYLGYKVSPVSSANDYT